MRNVELLEKPSGLPHSEWDEERLSAELVEWRGGNPLHQKAEE
jgi:hypothetical protein